MPKKGYKQTEEHNKNNSKAQIKIWARPGYKEMMGEIQRRARKGKHHSEETKKNMSEAHLGSNPECPNGTPYYWRDLSRKVWQETHGRSIPSWGLIHHWDWDWENIEPENLSLLKKTHHGQIHSKDIRGRSLREITPLLQENKIIGGTK